MNQFALITVAVAFIATLPSSAEVDQTNIAEKTPARGKQKTSIRTLCLGHYKKLHSVELSNGKNERIHFELFDDAFSPAQLHQGKTPIQIYRPGAQEPFATIKSLPQSSHLLLLFVPRQNKAEQPYIVIAIDDSKERFRYGTRRMFNFCRSKIALRYGKTAHIIPPGIKPKDVTVRQHQVNNKRFGIEFFQKENTYWKRFSATRWSFNRNKRSLVFFYNDPRSGRPTYRSVAEHYVDPILVKNKFTQNQRDAALHGTQDHNSNKEKTIPRPTIEAKGKTEPKIKPPA